MRGMNSWVVHLAAFRIVSPLELSAMDTVLVLLGVVVLYKICAVLTLSLRKG